MAAQDKKTKHDSIVQAAFEEFYQNGYERARMEQIAKQAGIGKSTIYEYFPSKQELLLEVVEEGLSQMHLEMEEIFLAEEPFAQKLRQFLLKEKPHHHKYNIAKMSRIWESISHIPEVKEIALQRLHEMGDVIRSAMQKAIEAGELRPDLDAELFFLWIKSLGAAIIFHQKVFSEAEAEKVLDMLMHGIGAS
jgi:AcrR family transcriptional regulator